MGINQKGVVAHYGTSISLYLIGLPLMRALQRMGWTVYAICSYDEWGKQIEASGINVIQVTLARRPGLRDFALGVYSLRRALREHQVQVLHTTNSIPGVVGRLVGWAARVPVRCHSYHGLPFYSGQPSYVNAIYWVAEWLACRVSSFAFFVNRDDIRLAIRSHMIDREKAVSCSWGIDLAEFGEKLGSVTKTEARRLLELQATDLVITKIARLEPVKGYDMFLEGFASFLQTHPNAVALLVGYGSSDYEQQLWQLAAYLGCSSRIRMLGFRRDIATILKASDLFVLTSKKEGLPETVMDAMVAGVPVVATDVPGTRELVRNGETGFLVSRGDVPGLVESMRCAVANSELTESLVRNAQTMIQEQHNIKCVARCISNSYELGLGSPSSHLGECNGDATQVD